MKPTLFLFLSLLISISTISCNSEKDKLVGTWTVSKVMTKETYEKGDKVEERFKETDEMLSGVFKGATLELRKDKTTTLKKDGKSQLEYTWQMDNGSGKNLELYNQSAEDGAQAEIVFWPVVKGAESLFYMKGIDTEITAQTILTEDNTTYIVYLSKNK